MTPQDQHLLRKCDVLEQHAYIVLRTIQRIRDSIVRDEPMDEGDLALIQCMETNETRH